MKNLQQKGVQWHFNMLAGNLHKEKAGSCWSAQGENFWTSQWKSNFGMKTEAVWIWGSNKQQAHHKGIFRPQWLRVLNANPRWCKEYLTLLQQCQRWSTPGRNFCVCDVVLIVYDTSPRNSWPLKRILENYPDKTGLVRQVKVKTNINELCRPKLCLENEWLMDCSEAKSHYLCLMPSAMGKR